MRRPFFCLTTKACLAFHLQSATILSIFFVTFDRPFLIISIMIRFLTGPSLYFTHRPWTPYDANFLESLGDKMVYFSQLIRDIMWSTSPVWVYYGATHYQSWTRNDTFFYLRVILTYHLIAYSSRTVGRCLNPVYRYIIRILFNNWYSGSSSTTMLRE